MDRGLAEGFGKHLHVQWKQGSSVCVQLTHGVALYQPDNKWLPNLWKE